MNRQQAQTLMSRILELPRDGELKLNLYGTDRLGTRFNDNAISQNALKQQIVLSLTARLEQKQASVNINTIDDMDVIQRQLQQVFAVCRHLPDDEEVLPATGNVIEAGDQACNDDTESLTVETIGDWVGSACAEGSAADVDLAGLLSVGRHFEAYADSAGGFAHERYHRVDCHVTATGTAGSGWAEHQGTGIEQAELLTATRCAIDKCQRAQDPVAFKPRPVTVILEPQAVGDLLSMAFWYGFNQRAKDEGRSAFSRYSDALGQLSLYSDPANPTMPCLSFNGDGERLQATQWLDRGELQQLITPRYWAQKQGLEPRPAPGNLILDGAGTSLDDMIANTDDGILVTRFWYIRATDPGTLGFTGMTRDGTFRIENGEITQPLVEMRWNESVLHLLNHVVDSGIPVATGEFFRMAMPALKVEAFPFSSLSA